MTQSVHGCWPRKQQNILKLKHFFYYYFARWMMNNCLKSRKCTTNPMKVINDKWWCLQGNNFFLISSNCSLMQSFPQRLVQSRDDQISLETMFPLISKYHTLTGTWTTTKRFSPDSDFLMEIYPSVNSVLAVNSYKI